MTESEAMGTVEPYIRYKARQMASPQFPFDDLCQEGRLAALFALRKGRTSSPEQFHRYAPKFIVNAMREYMHGYGNGIRKTRYAHRQGLPFLEIVTLDRADYHYRVEDQTRFVQSRLYIDGLLNALSPTDRQIVVLHSIHDWSFVAIGQALNVRKSTAFNRYRKAADWIRDALNGWEGVRPRTVEIVITTR